MAWRHEWPGNTYIACVHDMHEWHESHTVFTRIMNVLFLPKIDAKLGGGFSLCRVTFWVTFFLRFTIWCSGTAAVSEASLSCHSTTWSAINWTIFCRPSCATTTPLFGCSQWHRSSMSHSPTFPPKRWWFLPSPLHPGLGVHLFCYLRCLKN